MKKIIAFIVCVVLLIGCQKSILPEDAKSLSDPALKGASVELVVPDDYATIQLAVNAAADGETILIKPGVYKELVHIVGKNDLTLVGDNAILSPPDGLVQGDGHYNIDITGSHNIKVTNLKFDGQIETKEYPVYCAIGYTHSSGEASFNKIDGYSQGIVSWNPNPDAEALSLVITRNMVTDCYGGFEIQGNYDVFVEQNNISFNFDHARAFDEFFPFWHGVLMEGGTGVISKNKIKFKGGSVFLVSSVGVRLMKRDPAPHMVGLMKDMHDVEVSQCIINRTDVGIKVNSYDPLPIGEEWCIIGVRLEGNTFVQVPKRYEINNDCEDVVILSSAL